MILDIRYVLLSSIIIIIIIIVYSFIYSCMIIIYMIQYGIGNIHKTFCYGLKVFGRYDTATQV